jgi:hypothetical protein
MQGLDLGIAAANDDDDWLVKRSRVDTVVFVGSLYESLSFSTCNMRLGELLRLHTHTNTYIAMRALSS